MHCPTGKSSLPSFSTAAKARKRSTQKHGKAMSAYHCALCGDWHLGQPSGAKRLLKIISSIHELRFI